MSPHAITMLVAAALVAALLAAIATMIATSEQPDDVDPVIELVGDVDFNVELAEPFTDIDLGQLDGDVFAPAAPAAAGRHHHDTVEFVQLDYLIERAYATRIAPRTRVAGRAAVPE